MHKEPVPKAEKSPKSLSFAVLLLRHVLTLNEAFRTFFSRFMINEQILNYHPIILSCPGTAAELISFLHPVTNN